MAETQPCPVHTLLEDIENGSLFVYPVMKRLRDLDPQQCATAAEVHIDHKLIGAAHVFDFSGWPGPSAWLSDELWDTGDLLLNGGMAKLPFPTTIFSRRLIESTGQMYDLALISGAYADPENPGGEPVLGARTYQRMVGKTPWRFNGHTLLFNEEGEMGQQWLDSIEQMDETKKTMMEAITAGFFSSALGALSSKGPEIRTQPAPAKLNKQRAKKGRPPIFEYRIVEIPAWAKAKAEGLGGTHASPRLHWRRGHERRLGEGRKTFVHACLVGVAENGFIHKDYAVAPVPTD